jgi:hypothetical protein
LSQPNQSAGLIQSQSQALPATPEPLGYQVPAGLLDEVHAPDGSVRPEWKYLLDSFRDLGPKVLEEREEKIQRILGRRRHLQPLRAGKRTG